MCRVKETYYRTTPILVNRMSSDLLDSRARQTVASGALCRGGRAAATPDLSHRCSQVSPCPMRGAHVCHRGLAREPGPPRAAGPIRSTRVPAVGLSPSCALTPALPFRHSLFGEKPSGTSSLVSSLHSACGATSWSVPLATGLPSRLHPAHSRPHSPRAARGPPDYFPAEARSSQRPPAPLSLQFVLFSSVQCVPLRSSQNPGPFLRDFRNVNMNRTPGLKSG